MEYQKNELPGFNRKALVVEDDQVIAFIYRTYLERMSYQVKNVFNGEDALERTAEDYDVMLLDLGLLWILGEFVLCAIRVRELSTQKHLAIIINTAHGDEAKLQECREMGADAVFQKPLLLETLKQTLEEIIPSEKGV